MVSFRCNWQTSPLSVLDERCNHYFQQVDQYQQTHEQSSSSLSSQHLLQSVTKDLPPPSQLSTFSTDPPTPAGTLVTFTGLVQDGGNPEIYYQRYVLNNGVEKNGMFRDCLEGDIQEGSHGKGFKLAERLPLSLVSLPGRSKWVVGKRIVVGHGVDPNEAGLEGGGRKRGREEVKEDQEAGAEEKVDIGDGGNGGGWWGGGVSRRKIGHVDDRNGRANAGKTMDDTFDTFGAEAFVGRNFNVAGPEEASRGSTAICALVYDRDCSMPLHSAVRVIGIVWYNVGNVPRLHVLSLKKLSPVECHPLYEQIVLRPTLGHEMRDDIIRCLSRCLWGDVLAAEYCMMGLVSNVATRSAYTTLGKLTVNLVLPQGLSSVNLINVIDELFPRVVTVQVSMSSLNAGPLYPRKEADSDIVIASKLQVAPGTIVIIDETKMGEGQLSSVGVKNLRALAELAKRRVVPLELAYDSTEIETDCAVIVVSHTKALTPSDVAVYVPEQTRPLDMTLPTEEKLWRLRTVLGVIGEGGVHRGGFNVDQKVSAEIENTFVEERRKGLKNGEDVLQQWLSVARALTCSHGESELTVEIWRQSLVMEKARLERLPAQRK